jgi:hypothetical protein
MDQESDRNKIADTVVAMVKNREKSLEMVALAQKKIHAAQEKSMKVLSKSLEMIH